MNKTEMLAYKWLKKKGAKNIVYQKRKTPDFITSIGNYEAKRGYRLKNGEVKILLQRGQRQQLIATKSRVLVFLDDEEPLSIIDAEELHNLKVGNIILHDWGSTGKTVNISVALSREVLDRLNKLSEETGMSRSTIIEQVLRRHFKMGYLLSE